MCGSVGRRRRDREWLGGDCNHVIARARGEGPTRNPTAVGPLLEKVKTGRCEAVTNQASFRVEPLVEGSRVALVKEIATVYMRGRGEKGPTLPDCPDMSAP